MLKKTVIGVTAVLLLAFLYNFTRQISDSMQVSKRLDGEAEELVNLQKENSRLKKQLSESQTPQAVEEIARNKLNFARPGETVMIISPEQIDRLLAASEDKTAVRQSNWQGWLRLFWK